MRAWILAPSETFVAVAEGNRILGTCYSKPNRQGPGSHACNCGCVVAGDARGMGVASAMCVHSRDVAIAREFSVMQFNLVVSTNERAVQMENCVLAATIGILLSGSILAGNTPNTARTLTGGIGSGATHGRIPGSHPARIRLPQSTVTDMRRIILATTVAA